MTQGFDRYRPKGIDTPDEAPLARSSVCPIQRRASMRGQARDIVQHMGRGAPAPDAHAIASRGVAGPGGPLPHAERIQAAFGHHDVGQVKSHMGEPAAEASRALGARAYATGNDVAFASSPDLHTAAHEAAHVVQQRGGVQLAGGIGTEGDAYERHADAVADAVVAGRSAEGLLDRNAGRSGGASAIQRQAAPPGAGVVGSAGSAAGTGVHPLRQLTLTDFAMHADDRLDWANDATLDDSERAVLWAWLDFAHEAPSHLAGCGQMKVADLESAGRTPDVLGALRAYANAVGQDTPTVELTVPTDTVTTAVGWGREVARLEGAVGGATLNTIMRQAEFDALYAEPDGVTTCVDYVTAVRPVLHADNGTEIQSIIAMKQAGTDYKNYHTKLADVRNVHRFEEAALAQLESNVGDTSKSKPLTLILHSALDHNGAFHRDPYLTAVVTDSRNLTLMIEGATKLADVQSKVAPLAKAYGQGGKLDQVMVAGHGNAQEIELAGTGVPGKDQAVEVGDPLSDALLDEIARYIDPASPHHRVVFNACLTASNRVPQGVVTGTKPKKQARQIVEHIRKNPSLATYFEQRATGVGNPGVDARGANGSFGQIGLLDSSGGLDLVSSGDPELTSPKMDYVRAGVEALGVMRALLEVWASDRKGALDAARHRIANPLSTWDEPIVQVCLGLVLSRYQKDGAGIAALVDAAGALGHAMYRAHCRVDAIKPPRVPQALVPHIFGALVADPQLGGLSYYRLVLHEVWMRYDPARRTNFLADLVSGSFTCQTAKDFLDIGWLTPDLSALMGLAGSPTTDDGKTLVALHALAEGSRDAAVVGHVKALCQANGDRLPPSALTLLAGRMGEQSLLEAIGLRAPSAATPGTGASKMPKQPDNVDTDADGAVDQRFEPRRRSGVALRDTKVRSAPDAAGSVIGKLSVGDSVAVEGDGTGWLAVRHQRRLGYVDAASVA